MYGLGLGFSVEGLQVMGLKQHLATHTVDGQNPALPNIRNIP